MKIHGIETNKIIIKEIGHRVKKRRIALLMTQKELASEAGVSLRTVSNLENGKNISFDNLIAILRTIRTIDNLDLLIPENKIDPMEILNLGHERKRVSKTNKKANWKWGDEK